MACWWTGSGATSGFMCSGGCWRAASIPAYWTATDRWAWRTSSGRRKAWEQLFNSTFDDHWFFYALAVFFGLALLLSRLPDRLHAAIAVALALPGLADQGTAWGVPPIDWLWYYPFFAFGTRRPDTLWRAAPWLGRWPVLVTVGLIWVVLTRLAIKVDPLLGNAVTAALALVAVPAGLGTAVRLATLGGPVARGLIADRPQHPAHLCPASAGITPALHSLRPARGGAEGMLGAAAGGRRYHRVASARALAEPGAGAIRLAILAAFPGRGGPAAWGSLTRFGKGGVLEAILQPYRPRYFLRNIIRRLLRQASLLTARRRYHRAINAGGTFADRCVRIGCEPLLKNFA